MIKRNDFGAIHDALNKMIIAEVKAWLEQMPEQKMEAEGQVPLCRIVVSPDCDYSPRDLSVRKVWIDENGLLNIYGSENHPNVEVDTEWDENDDLLDITDFGYLIDQMVEQLKMPEGAWYIMEGYMMSCCYRMEENMKQAIEKEVTI